jgi:hypothetical protein
MIMLKRTRSIIGMNVWLFFLWLFLAIWMLTMDYLATHHK